MIVHPETIVATGTQNALNFGFPGNFDYHVVLLIRCNNATALTINGIDAAQFTQLEGVFKPVLIFTTVGAGSVIFNDENAGATAANRIRVVGESVTLAPPGAGGGESALIGYDSTSSRWRLLLRGSSFG
jgi:hypothetical protein